MDALLLRGKKRKRHSRLDHTEHELPSFPRLRPAPVLPTSPLITYSSLLPSSTVQKHEENQGADLPEEENGKDWFRAKILHVAYRSQTEVWLDNESWADAYSRLLAARTLRNNGGKADSMPSKPRSLAVPQLSEEEFEGLKASRLSKNDLTNERRLSAI